MIKRTVTAIVAVTWVLWLLQTRMGGAIVIHALQFMALREWQAMTAPMRGAAPAPAWPLLPLTGVGLGLAAQAEPAAISPEEVRAHRDAIPHLYRCARHL